MREKIRKFLCKIRSHRWNEWFTYGPYEREKYRKCKCCPATQTRKKIWLTARGTFVDCPTPLGRHIGQKELTIKEQMFVKVIKRYYRVFHNEEIF